MTRPVDPAFVTAAAGDAPPAPTIRLPRSGQRPLAFQGWHLACLGAAANDDAADGPGGPGGDLMLLNLFASAGGHLVAQLVLRDGGIDVTHVLAAADRDGLLEALGALDPVQLLGPALPDPAAGDGSPEQLMAWADQAASRLTTCRSRYAHLLAQLRGALAADPVRT